MNQPDALSVRAGGLKTAIDTIVAPKDAFESLRSAPTWGWAFLISCALMVVGYFLQHPAMQHASIGTMQHALNTNPIYASMSDDQKQQALDRIAHPPAFQTALGLVSVAVTLFVSAAVNAAILLGATAIARGEASFGRLFAGSMNIAVPSLGIFWVVLGIICQVLGADHFSTMTDVFRSVPSLATIAPGVTGKLGIFLSGVHIFTLWGCALNIVMMRVTAGVKGALSWIGPVFILVLGALAQAVIGGYLQLTRDATPALAHRILGGVNLRARPCGKRTNDAARCRHVRARP